MQKVVQGLLIMAGLLFGKCRGRDAWLFGGGCDRRSGVKHWKTAIVVFSLDVAYVVWLSSACIVPCYYRI